MNSSPPWPACIKAEIRAKHLQLIVDLEAEPPILCMPIRRDCSRCCSISPVKNATKFTLSSGRGQNRPCELARTTPPAALDIQVHVKDTGIGMSPDILGRLFQPFRNKAPDETVRRYGGLGLASAISSCLDGCPGGETAWRSVKGWSAKDPRFLLQLLGRASVWHGTGSAAFRHWW